MNFLLCRCTIAAAAAAAAAVLDISHEPLSLYARITHQKWTMEHAPFVQEDWLGIGVKLIAFKYHWIQADACMLTNLRKQKCTNQNSYEYKERLVTLLNL